jgi:hypothetical protein
MAEKKVRIERTARHKSGPKCSVCVHPEREAIDLAIVGQQKLSALENRYSLNRYALGRHRSHIIELVARSPEGEKLARADTIVAEIAQLEDLAVEVLDRARLAKDGRLTLAAISTMKALLEFRARVTGALKSPAKGNTLHIHFADKEGFDDRLERLIRRARPAIDVKLAGEGNALPPVTGG